MNEIFNEAKKADNPKRSKYVEDTFKHAYMVLAKRYPGRIWLCPNGCGNLHFERNAKYKEYTDYDAENRLIKKCQTCKASACDSQYRNYRYELTDGVKAYFAKTEEKDWNYHEFKRFLYEYTWIMRVGIGNPELKERLD